MVHVELCHRSFTCTNLLGSMRLVQNENTDITKETKLQLYLLSVLAYQFRSSENILKGSGSYAYLYHAIVM